MKEFLIQVLRGVGRLCGVLVAVALVFLVLLGPFKLALVTEEWCYLWLYLPHILTILYFGGTPDEGS